eukprot:snap_masked-scaffold_8-processed-gene-14.81-mRNA-1 protein AED:1.00 eAED:1.00 QI:0/0/0/0/1/1/3/0/136
MKDFHVFPLQATKRFLFSSCSSYPSLYTTCSCSEQNSHPVDQFAFFAGCSSIYQGSASKYCSEVLMEFRSDFETFYGILWITLLVTGGFLFHFLFFSLNVIEVVSAQERCSASAFSLRIGATDSIFVSFGSSGRFL